MAAQLSLIVVHIRRRPIQSWFFRQLGLVLVFVLVFVVQPVPTERIARTVLTIHAMGSAWPRRAEGARAFHAPGVDGVLARKHLRQSDPRLLSQFRVSSAPLQRATQKLQRAPYIMHGTKRMRKRKPQHLSQLRVVSPAPLHQPHEKLGIPERQTCEYLRQRIFT